MHAVGVSGEMSVAGAEAVDMYDGMMGVVLDKRVLAGVHENFLTVLGGGGGGRSRFVGGELKKLQSAQDVLHWMGAFFFSTLIERMTEFFTIIMIF